MLFLTWQDFVLKMRKYFCAQVHDRNDQNFKNEYKFNFLNVHHNMRIIIWEGEHKQIAIM